MSDKGEITRRSFLRAAVATAVGAGLSYTKLATGEPTKDEIDLRKSLAIKEYNRIVNLNKYQIVETGENEFNYHWVEMKNPDKVFMQEIYLADVDNLHMPIYLVISDPITLQTGKKTVGVISHVSGIKVLEFGHSPNKAISQTKRDESEEIIAGIAYYPPNELEHLDLVKLKNPKADITRMRFELEGIIGIDKKAI